MILPELLNFTSTEFPARVSIRIAGLRPVSPSSRDEPEPAEGMDSFVVDNGRWSVFSAGS